MDKDEALEDLVELAEIGWAKELLASHNKFKKLETSALAIIQRYDMVEHHNIDPLIEALRRVLYD